MDSIGKDLIASEDGRRIISSLPANDLFTKEAVEEAPGTVQFRLAGVPIQIIDFVDWKVSGPKHGLASGVVDIVSGALAEREYGSPQPLVLCGQKMVVFRDPPGRSSGQIAIVDDHALSSFLEDSFPGQRITAVLRRLATLLMAGYSLTEAAKIDGKSFETIKSQARELKGRLGLRRTDDIGRVLATMVIATVTRIASGDSRNTDFNFYCENYLPRRVRSLSILGRKGHLQRSFDMGPIGGRPIICLHPLVPPNFREADIDLLYRLKLRLFWPLRNGVLASDDPVLSNSEHLDHACEGIDQIQRTFVGDRVTLLSFNASAKVALTYATANPDAVRRLYMGGLCVRDEVETTVAQRFARGMVSLVMRDRELTRNLIGYLHKNLLTPDRLLGFLKHHFRDRPADLEIVEEEFSGPHGVNRLRFALTRSLASREHEYEFQAYPSWEAARSLRASIDILHGDRDVMHPLSFVEAFAATIPGAQFHRLKGAGDLLYHDHLKSILTFVAGRN